MSRQITINDIIKMFLAHIKLILILTVVGAIVSFVYVKCFVPEMYSTTAIILVQSDSALGGATASDNSSGEKVDTNSISQSVELANTCKVMFERHPMMRSIISGNTVSINAIEDSYLMEIKVTSSDPLTACSVANQIAEAAPEVFEYYFGEGGKVDTVDDAAIPSRPSSPDVKKYVLMGLLAGLVLALGISFLLEIVDTTVKPGDDLYDIYKIPVFAEIVDFDLEGGAKK